ncbi:MAG: hypothetical protein LBH43_11205 [Treponema sp.]|jgi:hypothetical protein|nr:hypothetical protein [Treponema sp.]
MKVKLPVRAGWVKLKGNELYVVLKETNKAGADLFRRIFKKKKEMEDRNKKEFFLWVELDLRYQHRTYKQNNTVWTLITAIFMSMEGRLPDEEEKYNLYLDLLEQYADRVPNRFGGLRPVHISESNSLEGARFIDGLLYCITTMCDLDMNTQTSVIDVMQEWLEWRGKLECDPIDYADIECTRLITESEWREKHRVSEASGHGGDIVLHHIVTRGSNKAAENKAWNWLALTNDEHMMIHNRGDDYFLSIYSHLKGKFERANKLAAELIHPAINGI